MDPYPDTYIQNTGAYQIQDPEQLSLLFKISGLFF